LLSGTMPTMNDQAAIPLARISALQNEENARFDAEHPRSMALLSRAQASMPRGVPMSWMESLYEHSPLFVESGDGSRFSDVDGRSYLDMYIGDMSGFCGHAPPSVVEAVSRRMARGNHFLLPGEDAIVVAEHLALRYKVPKWQFTLSATQANAEVIRLARHITGREVVVLFDGKYHGHGDATLVVAEGGSNVAEYQGLPSSVTGQARIVSFNDIPAIEAALAPRDVALVMTEPVMTNAGIINPDPGFHEALRRMTRESGTLLALDETHSLVGAYGGMSGELGLVADLLTIGKSIAAGVPLGAYGMTEEVAAVAAPTDAHNLVSGATVPEVATGGTLFANALSMAASRAALTEVLTPDAFTRARALGTRMVEGLEAAIAAAGLPWNVSQMGTHAYYGFTPVPARNGIESRANDDVDLRALMRVWMANRGVWESGWWLGPTVSVAHTEPDVDEYVATFGQFLAAVL
jgi:glutamate-1-semialdehyde 2,1-aminomutase